MVDPNRKINRLTAEDIAFLDECEELFGNRFSESDEEFKAHCEKRFPETPVIMNFSSGGGSQGQNSSYRGRYNDNRQNYRGGRGGNQRGYHRRDQYNKRGGSGGGGDDRGSHQYRNYRNYNERNDERAMNVRREYGKFVAASNSERTGGTNNG